MLCFIHIHFLPKDKLCLQNSIVHKYLIRSSVYRISIVLKKSGRNSKIDHKGLKSYNAMLKVNIILLLFCARNYCYDRKPVEQIRSGKKIMLAKSSDLNMAGFDRGGQCGIKMVPNCTRISVILYNCAGYMFAYSSTNLLNQIKISKCKQEINLNLSIPKHKVFTSRERERETN